MASRYVNPYLNPEHPANVRGLIAARASQAEVGELSVGERNTTSKVGNVAKGAARTVALAGGVAAGAALIGLGVSRLDNDPLMNQTTNNPKTEQMGQPLPNANEVPANAPHAANLSK